MNSRILIKSSLRALNHHKGRSFLTILGIIVGIASIIATLAIGYGAEEKMRKSILAIGNNYIELWRGNFTLEGATKSIKQKETKKLTTADVTSLNNQCPGIKKISPVIFDRGIIEYHGSAVMCDIKGGNDELLSVMGRSLSKGANMTQHHIQKGTRVALLGDQTAKDLFKTVDPIGRTIKVKNILFTVIGVIKKIDNAPGHRDPNLDVIIPFTSAKKYLKNHNSSTIHGIVIAGKSLDKMPTIVRQIKKIMRARHNLGIDEPNDFSIIDQASMLKAAKASSTIFNIFLLIVASISLLVGGIGVMNIMLVSVTERTQEIGIRMALGASHALILQQFLIESVVLCFIGGIIGIVLGLVTPFIAQYTFQLPAVIRIEPIIVAFCTIFLIGLIFGFYPAQKAARLNPVEALLKQ
ncbi:ABC transporter permease [bacterium]|nr:MAG: ABC transporter permease [bacterium]